MKLRHRLLTAAAVAGIAVCAPRALALVSLEDGRDHLFVDGTVEMGYDSNVFANAQSGGSMLVEGTLSTEFARRAGLIGVNVTASVTFARYANFREQDYVDPKVTAEFTKQTGRTTGSLLVSAQRENRADVDANTRDVSWNYDVALNFQYPVIQRYSISGSFEYNYADYQDQQLFTNLATYTGNLYLFYILSEQRDFFIDYRERYSQLADGSDDIDDSLSAGLNGRVFGPFNGSLQGGYTIRTTSGGADAGPLLHDAVRALRESHGGASQRYGPHTSTSVHDHRFDGIPAQVPRPDARGPLRAPAEHSRCALTASVSAAVSMVRSKQSLQRRPEIGQVIGLVGMTGRGGGHGCPVRADGLLQ